MKRKNERSNPDECSKADVPDGAEIAQDSFGGKTLECAAKGGHGKSKSKYNKEYKKQLLFVGTRELVPAGTLITRTEKVGRSTIKFVEIDGQEWRVDTYKNINRNSLKYIDTQELVPYEAQITIQKKGRKTLKFVVRDGQQVQVESTNNLHQTRLIFVDTHKDVPQGTEITQEKEGENTVKYALRDGRKVRVDTYLNLYNAHLQFVDTHKDVPQGAEIIQEKEGENTVRYALRDGRKVQVDTYKNISRSLLKFAGSKEPVPEGMNIVAGIEHGKRVRYAVSNGKKRRVGNTAHINSTSLRFVGTEQLVPDDAEVFTKKIGRRTIRYVYIDGKKVPVDTTYNIKYTRSQHANDRPRVKFDEVFSSRKITVGISYQDLSLPAIPELPSALSMQPTPSLHRQKLHFKPLTKWPSSNSNALPELIAWESDEYQLALYSESNFTQKSQLCFIFAGKKSDTFLPEIEEADSQFRLILVIPHNELSIFRPYIAKGISLLCIKELKSKTHGHYEKLEHINSRRIAAFIAAMHFSKEYGIDHALMCDNNLTHVFYQNDHDYTWSDWFQDMVRELGVKACVSIATPSKKSTKLPDAYMLGSKLFLFNLKLISQTLPHNSSGFDLFYPAHANDFWGGDYLFQLILHEFGATHDSPYNGFGIIDPSRMMIGCSVDNQRGVRKKVYKKANEINLSFEHLFPESVSLLLSLETIDKIAKSLKRLNDIILENTSAYNELLVSRAREDILKLHAEAHQLGPIREPRLMVASDASSEDFLSEFFIELKRLISLNLCQLRPYQKVIIEEIITQGGKGNLKGTIDMATGTGKTHVEIILALAAQRTHKSGAVIIVTPFIQLARQMLEQYLGVLTHLGMQEYSHYVIQVDSHSNNITRGLLELNQTLSAYPCVYICCAASYDRLLKSKNSQNNPLVNALKNPNVLILDESHLFSEKTIKRIKKGLSTSPNTFLASLTATVTRNDFQDFYISYSRKLAVEQRYITPSILDMFNQDYSEEAVLAVIGCMEKILEWKSPNGKALREEKGIIYVPNSSESMNYSQILHQHLSSKGIPSLQINSDSNRKQLTENIKAFTSSDSPDVPLIALCKNMLKVGFSFDEIYWIIDLRFSAAHDFAQAAGRAMRLCKESNPNKIAYFLSWKNVKFHFVFPEKTQEALMTADKEALLLACSDYVDTTESFKIIPYSSSLGEFMMSELDEDGVASITSNSDMEVTSESEMETPRKKKGRRHPASSVSDEDASSIISESETETPPKKKGRLDSTSSVSEEDVEPEKKKSFQLPINHKISFFPKARKERGASSDSQEGYLLEI